MIPVISVREQVAKSRAVKVGDNLKVIFTYDNKSEENTTTFKVITISKGEDRSIVYVLHRAITFDKGSLMIITIYPHSPMTIRYMKDYVHVADVKKIVSTSSRVADGVVTRVGHELMFSEHTHESVKRAVVPGDKLGSPRRDYEVEYITSSGDIIAKAEKGSTVVISRRDYKLIESLNQNLEWVDESEVYAA